MPSLRSSIIISVYTDAEALDRVIMSLHAQSVSNFEIIISEDGESDAIRDYLAGADLDTTRTQHLTQKDDGFRKNRALNRAIVAARSDHLIFIDGDCVTHPRFIEAHQRYSTRGVVTSGRRIELGEKTSESVREDFSNLQKLSSNVGLLLALPRLMRDKHWKNLEAGFYSPALQWLTKDKKARVLGCNFSCDRHDLLTINGFNEDYLFPGTGEDTDIDWRLRRSGIKILNIKFSAIQYHLHHVRTYNRSTENREILKKTREQDLFICRNGIRKHT